MYILKATKGKLFGWMTLHAMQDTQASDSTSANANLWKCSQPIYMKHTVHKDPMPGRQPGYLTTGMLGMHSDHRDTSKPLAHDNDTNGKSQPPRT
eukprot:1147374-Pelagomonas_calceolata.AAC.13